MKFFLQILETNFVDGGIINLVFKQGLKNWANITFFYLFLVEVPKHSYLTSGFDAIKLLFLSPFIIYQRRGNIN
jgi:hypothetical protein